MAQEHAVVVRDMQLYHSTSLRGKKPSMNQEDFLMTCGSDDSESLKSNKL